MNKLFLICLILVVILLCSWYVFRLRGKEENAEDQIKPNFQMFSTVSGNVEKVEDYSLTLKTEYLETYSALETTPIYRFEPLDPEDTFYLEEIVLDDFIQRPGVSRIGFSEIKTQDTAYLLLGILDDFSIQVIRIVVFEFNKIGVVE